MPTNADAFFCQGKTHPICQDYARVAKESPTRAFLADGCSSSPDTDFGARFLVRSCEEITNSLMGDTSDDASPELIGSWVRSKTKTVVAILDMAPECLDATLGLAQVLSDGFGRAILWGDGVVGAIRRDGTRVFYVVKYLSGAPPYLNYRLNQKRMDKYNDLHWGKFEIRCYENGILQSRIEDGDNTLMDSCSWVFDPAEYVAFVICSDGIESFEHSENGVNVPIPVTTMMEMVLDMNSFNGEFIVRNVSNFMLNRVCKKKNWNHYDDLSVVGIYLGDNGGAF